MNNDYRLLEKMDRKLDSIQQELQKTKSDLDTVKQDLYNLKNKRTSNWAYFWLLVIALNTCSGKNTDNTTEDKTTNKVTNTTYKQKNIDSTIPTPIQFIKSFSR